MCAYQTSVFLPYADKTEMMDSDDAGHLNKCTDENHALAEHIYITYSEHHSANIRGEIREMLSEFGNMDISIMWYFH